MATVYVDHSGTRIRLQSGSLVLESPAGRRTVPARLLRRLVITAKSELDSGTLNRLAEAGIAVVLLDPHRCRRRALVLGGHQPDAGLRLAQYRAAQDTAFRLEIARALVRAKLQRQLRWLASSSCPSCDAARRRLQGILTRLDGMADPAGLRGLEGSAGRAFFAAYRRLFPDHLGFDGRRRRPPPDPVNACLSLGYALLHSRAVQAAWSAGLDPMIGFYHEPAWGRESLACDLIEPWRPCIERWVAGWFGQRWLEAGHFSRQGDSVRLGKAGRQRFFGAFEKGMPPVERSLRRQIRHLIQRLERL
ncbi:CRISPR-associated protein Cas1 [Methylomarinovum tepidoasis]|uniref:CRISPR-associated endonuclease Cas1 n=1 Tax=Methylomarinovum tepidoasis TaxID=2840183 RepID=A0AAU9CRE0_9GAMM|nr:CRISPR-associated endonuclease Cas1 [Methylomarinovum sp. IN45]BCX88953.1 CRISPR-associated protein Cas1 [Methylomarinovum sp. IN45]